MSEGFQSYCLRWGELSFKMGEGILGSYGQDRRRALPLQTDRRCSSAAVIPATFRCSFFSRGRYFSRWHFDCQRLACGGLIIHAEKLTNWALHPKGSLSLQAVHTLGDFSCHRRDNPLGEFFFFYSEQRKIFMWLSLWLGGNNQWGRCAFHLCIWKK